MMCSIVLNKHVKNVKNYWSYFGEKFKKRPKNSKKTLNLGFNFFSKIRLQQFSYNIALYHYAKIIKIL